MYISILNSMVRYTIPTTYLIPYNMIVCIVISMCNRIKILFISFFIFNVLIVHILTLNKDICMICNATIVRVISMITD